MKKIKFIFIVIFSSGQAEVSQVLTGDSIEAPGYPGKQKVIWPKEKMKNPKNVRVFLSSLCNEISHLDRETEQALALAINKTEMVLMENLSLVPSFSQQFELVKSTRKDPLRCRKRFV